MSWDTNNGKWFVYKTIDNEFEENRLVVKREMNYPTDTTLSDNGKRYTFSYNQENKLSIKIQQNWNSINDSWDNFKKAVFTYDEGKTGIFLNWDMAKDEWVNDRYNKYVLNNKGQTIYQIKKEWKIDKAQWENTYKEERKYDNQGNLIQRKEFVWSDSSVWNTMSQSDYFWTIFNTNSINDFNQFDLEIFPNPVKNFLFISNENIVGSSKVEIFGINGDKLIETNLRANRPIDISYFKNGLYVLKISNEDGFASKSFIVQK